MCTYNYNFSLEFDSKREVGFCCKELKSAYFSINLSIFYTLFSLQTESCLLIILIFCAKERLTSLKEHSRNWKHCAAAYFIIAEGSKRKELNRCSFTASCNIKVGAAHN